MCINKIFSSYTSSLCNIFFIRLHAMFTTCEEKVPDTMQVEDVKIIHYAVSPSCSYQQELDDHFFPSQQFIFTEQET